MVADLPSLNGAAWLRLPLLEELEMCSDEGIFRHAVTALAGALVAVSWTPMAMIQRTSAPTESKCPRHTSSANGLPPRPVVGLPVCNLS